MSSTFEDCSIKLIEARIRNFRSLRNVDLSFDRLTLLIGENNVGKTSFLDALNASIGIGKRNFSEQDIYLAPGETKLPSSRGILVDLLFRPVDLSGKVFEVFPEGSYWLELWGNAVAQDEADNDFVAVRVQFLWNSTKGEYITERKFLVNWPKSSEELADARIKENSGGLNSSQIEALSFFYMDAKRDIKDELQNRSSFWSKMVSEHGLSEEKIVEIEESLNSINNNIIKNSSALTHITSHLNDLYRTVSCEKESIIISPLTRHLRDISKGMDVYFNTRDAQSFPLVQHGMGTRSLASILTFRAYTSWRKSKAKTQNLHSILALEEPETHLHPQAQRALFSQLEKIPGQVFISSHSPYIVSQAEIGFVRHFRKLGSETIVTCMDMSSLEPEDVRKINRMVLNTRGDMLFASALVFFEGETEEQALPIFAEEYWGIHPNSLGVTFVGVGGSGNYLPFLRLSSSFNIPWYIFSDAEDKPLKELQKALKNIGITDYQKSPNVVVLPTNQNFESYLVGENYGDTFVEMLEEQNDQEDYIDDYIKIHSGGPGKKGKGIRDYSSTGGLQRAIIDCLSEGKTKYGGPIARKIASIEDPERRFPAKIKELFERISNDLHIKDTKGENHES